MRKAIEFILSVIFTACCIVKILVEHIYLVPKFMLLGVIKGYIQAFKMTSDRFDELEKRSI